MYWCEEVCVRWILASSSQMLIAMIAVVAIKWLTLLRIGRAIAIEEATL